VLVAWNCSTYGVAASGALELHRIRHRCRDLRGHDKYPHRSAILFGTILSRGELPAPHVASGDAHDGFDSMTADRQFVVVDDAKNVLPECPQLKLLRMEGSIYFGATQHVGDRLFQLRQGGHRRKQPAGAGR